MPPVTVQLTEVIRRDDMGLVRRARDGDAEAFDAIAMAFLPDAYRLASAILGGEAEAADASQNAFVAAWRDCRTFARSTASRPGSAGSS